MPQTKMPQQPIDQPEPSKQLPAAQNEIASPSAETAANESLDGETLTSEADADTSESEVGNNQVVDVDTLIDDETELDNATLFDEKSSYNEDSASDNSQQTEPTVEVEATGSGRFNPKELLRQYGATALACCLCLVLGFAASWFTRPQSVVPQEEATAEQPRPVYVAATSRRNEPISPLAPFADLEPRAIELGKRLFHDPGLSGDARISCASCHQVDQGGEDGRPVSIGIGKAVGNVNAPTVLNAALNFVQFWDGRVETLEEQLEIPIHSETEMGSSWERVVSYLTHNNDYMSQFEEVFGGPPTEERVKEAIVAYERSLITIDSPFDDWLKGDELALDSDEYSGYYLFKQLNCIACHQGPAIGGTMFQKLGEAKTYFADPQAVREIDLGRFNVTGHERDKFVFRVPALRNVASTGPYLHDGSVETLEQAVEIMIEYQVGVPTTSEDVRRIVAFLKSLSGRVPE
ncbi:MAG: c-type cytochrome [Planctomycetales bacterium]|nr:c-type cytochrome [Planctomycetales bacterium]